MNFKKIFSFSFLIERNQNITIPANSINQNLFINFNIINYLIIFN